MDTEPARIEIQTTLDGSGVPVVHVKGDVDIFTCPELRTALLELLEAGKHDIVLDLSEVNYMDSRALGVLVEAAHRARAEGRRLHLVRVPRRVKSTFEITRLMMFFRWYDTAEAALAEIARGAAPGADRTEGANGPPTGSSGPH